MEKTDLKHVKMVVESAKIADDSIVIPKIEIVEWAEHYAEVGHETKKNGCPTWQSWFYWGKREVLVDLLKHFERYEG